MTTTETTTTPQPPQDGDRKTVAGITYEASIWEARIHWHELQANDTIIARSPGGRRLTVLRALWFEV